MDSSTPSKIDLNHTDERVIFNFCDCSLDKKHSFYNLAKEEATKLIKKLCHIEQMTWRQWSSLPRKEGLTPEISGTKSFKMIKERDSSEQQLAGERYYFHFRVEKNGKFRVFGYQKGQLFCITHIDPEGRIHHH